MSLRTPVAPGRAGTDLVGTAADVAGDTWVNGGNDYVVIKNSAVGSINVTLNIQAAAADGALGTITDPVVAVGAGVTKVIGPFPPGMYNDANGIAGITYSAVVTVTVTVIRCVS